MRRCKMLYEFFYNNESKIPLLGWRHRLFRHCNRCAARRHISPIPVNHLPRTSMDKMKDNSFKLTKERSRRYRVQTITDADHADDIALLARTPVQALSQLLSLEGTVVGRGLHINEHKMEYLCLIKEATCPH